MHLEACFEIFASNSNDHFSVNSLIQYSLFVNWDSEAIVEFQPLTILYLCYIKVHVRKYVSVSMTDNIKITTVL